MKRTRRRVIAQRGNAGNANASVLILAFAGVGQAGLKAMEVWRFMCHM